MGNALKSRTATALTTLAQAKLTESEDRTNTAQRRNQGQQSIYE
jgi:hypothetical protein